MLILRDAGSAVIDLDTQRLCAPATADDHLSMLRVAHGIEDQVEQNPFQHDGIAAHPGSARYHPQRELLFERRPRKSRLDPREHASDRKLRNVWSNGAGIELGDIQERSE